MENLTIPFIIIIIIIIIKLLLSYSTAIVCRGSIMVTTSDFQSGRLGSSPSRDHYSMRLDRGTGLIRAFIPPG